MFIVRIPQLPRFFSEKLQVIPELRDEMMETLKSLLDDLEASDRINGDIEKVWMFFLAQAKILTLAFFEGLLSTEVALMLPTQEPQVRIPAHYCLVCKQY